MQRRFVFVLSIVAASCSSAPPTPASDPPSAEPIAFKLNQAAKDAPADVKPDPRSVSRVLGYVEGEVVTYRDVLLEVGPQLAMTESPEERDKIENKALLEILETRVVYRAARDLGVDVTRDEVDAERETRLVDLKKNGGTLEAYLAERGMTRREFDERIRRDLVMRKYMLAAIGHSQDAAVRVRPVADTYVSPGDVEKYYARNPDRFREPATARCRLMSFATDMAAPDRVKAVAEAKARAEAALARLKSGEDWVPVYRDAQKGDATPDPFDGLMDIRRGEKAEWIESFAFASDKGVLSDPVIQKNTTFYVLRAEGSHAERTVPFDECQAKVRMMLSEQRREVAGYEVELTLLDQTTVSPESLGAKLRDWLRAARRKVLGD